VDVRLDFAKRSPIWRSDYLSILRRLIVHHFLHFDFKNPRLVPSHELVDQMVVIVGE